MARKMMFLILTVTLSISTLSPAGEAEVKNLPGADFQPGKLKLPLVVTERSSLTRKGVVVSSGVPFPPGFLTDVGKLRVVDAAGKAATDMVGHFRTPATWRCSCSRNITA